ncbi:MAG: hypothetical protein J6T54_06480 [Fibrobacter sp.]|nr:hypothetical protein [Fibrobacter sp.]
MYIHITKTDCAKIVNESLQGGGVKNTELEIALAKKCLALYDHLRQINNERNEYFEAIYSATVKFEKATKGTLKHKRAADLAIDSKAHFAAAVKLDGELKELMNGTGENQDGRGTGEA